MFHFTARPSLSLVIISKGVKVIFYLLHQYYVKLLYQAYRSSLMTYLDCPDFKVNLYCHKSDKIDVFSS